MTLERYRDDFPQLQRKIYDHPLTYLDTAATSLKPRQVIERLSEFYLHEYGTVRRGVYLLSQEATKTFEGVRASAARFLNAGRAEEVVFVRGVTEGMNLLANSLGEWRLEPGDEILISEMEHHANILPWQFVAKRTGAKIIVAPITDKGDIDLDALRERVTSRTKIVSIVHISNALGTVNPVAAIGEIAHEAGALMIVDGAQSAPHIPVDVQALGCDFYVCSGHKMYGPTGAGLLYGRYELLAEMPPFLGGGEMIDKVTFESATFEEPPHRFEAGTPQIGEVIGLGAAIDYLNAIGMSAIAEHDAALTRYCEEKIREVPGVEVIGSPRLRSGLVPFVMEGGHPFDIGTLLDREGIAIRVGHHCAQPLLRRLGLSATARASFGIYNNFDDIDRFIDGLNFVSEMLA